MSKYAIIPPSDTCRLQQTHGVFRVSIGATAIHTAPLTRWHDHYKCQLHGWGAASCAQTIFSSVVSLRINYYFIWILQEIIEKHLKRLAWSIYKPSSSGSTHKGVNLNDNNNNTTVLSRWHRKIFAVRFFPYLFIVANVIEKLKQLKNHRCSLPKMNSHVIKNLLAVHVRHIIILGPRLRIHLQRIVQDASQNIKKNMY